MSWLRNRIVFNLITSILGLVGGALTEVGLQLAGVSDPKLHLLALVLPIAGGLLRDPAILTKIFGVTPPALLLLVVGGLLFAAPAQAQEAPPPVNLFCFDLAKLHCVRPVAGFSGTAFTLSQGSPLRSVQISGLFEVDLWPGRLGAAAGASFQAGDFLAVSATGLLTVPLVVPAGSKVVPAFGVSASLLGERNVVSGIVGAIARF